MERKTILYIFCAIIVIGLGIYLMCTQHLTPKDTVIIHWNVDPNPMRKVTVPAFEKLNPNIHVVVDPNCDITTVMTQLAGGVAPDIITCYTIESFRKLAALNQLEDLTPYVKKYNMPVDKIRPSLHDYVYLKDDKTHIYGIPENGGPFIVFYNKDIFDKYNVPYPTNDWTWDDMREKAKLLTKYKTINGRQVADVKGMYIYNDPEFFIRMFGGRLFNEDGTKCLIDSPEAIKGLEYWETLMMKDKVIPNATEETSMAPMGTGGAALLMMQNKVAMTLIGRWEITQYRDYYSKGIRFGMVKFPKAPFSNNIQLSKCYAIPKGSKHKEEAAKFLAYILSKENQILMTNYGDGWGSVEDPDVDKIAYFNPEYPQEDNNKALLDDFNNAEMNETSYWITYVDYRQIWTDEIEKVWLGDQNMKQACKNMAYRMNQIINRNIKNPNFL